MFGFRVFARCRSLQLLDIATDECPRWIFACCCLHNLLERTHEPFDRAWLEVEDVFPDVALEHGAAADGGEADAAEEVAVLSPQQRDEIAMRETSGTGRTRIIAFECAI